MWNLIRVVACATIAAHAAKPTLKVLFAGNSLTYVSDLPGLCQKLFASPSSVANLVPASSVMGGASFRDHSRDPATYSQYTDGLKTVQAIRQGGWDFVVLQDQSGSWFYLEPPFLNEYGNAVYNPDGSFTGKYKTYPSILMEEAYKVNASVSFFGTWRTRTDGLTDETQAFATKAYSYIAKTANTFMAPAGDALVLLHTYVGDALYADDIHPAPIAQYSNACVFYATLTGQSPVGLGDGGTGLGATYNLTLVQQFAWTAYTAYKTFQEHNCTHEMCVQFIESDGTRSSTPAARMTTAPPPTTAYSEPFCGYPEAQALNLLPSSLLTPAQGTYLSDEIRLFCPAEWVVCYTATGAKANGNDFHTACDKRGPTLVVVRAGNRVFGGFTSTNWSQAGASHAPGAFLFRVDNNGNVGLQDIETGFKADNNMYDMAGSCPLLGVQADLNLGNCQFVNFVPYGNYSHQNPAYKFDGLPVVMKFASWLTGAAFQDLPVWYIEVFTWPKSAPTTKAPTTVNPNATTSTTLTISTTPANSTSAASTSVAASSTPNATTPTVGPTSRNATTATTSAAALNTSTTTVATSKVANATTSTRGVNSTVASSTAASSSSPVSSSSAQPSSSPTTKSPSKITTTSKPAVTTGTIVRTPAASGKKKSSVAVTAVGIIIGLVGAVLLVVVAVLGNRYIKSRKTSVVAITPASGTGGPQRQVGPESFDNPFFGTGPGTNDAL